MKYNSSLVTVYITNYNYQDYLEEAFTSLVNQTYNSIEIIIIDDGSTDNSINIIKRLSEKHENIQTIFQKNKGLNKTNNVAIKKARGKYIMRLDADDILEPKAIEKMVKVLDENDNIGLVFPDYYLMDENGFKFSAHKRYNFDTDVLLFDRPAHGACTMIRISFLKAVNGYDEDFTCQDGYEIWLKFITHYQVKNINEPLFYYRQHSSNLTKNETKILSTRAAINKKSVQTKNINIESILILPIRNDKKYLKVIAGESILEKKINVVLLAEIPKKIIVTSSSKDIKEFVQKRYKDESKIIFIERSEVLERKTTPLSETINFIQKQIDVNYNAIQIISPDFPFIESYSIDDALNTMFLFGSDSIISVREDNHMFFQHHGKGMEPILNQNKFTKLERDTLFKSVGGISAVKKEAFDLSNEIITGRVGHLMVEEKASIELKNQYGLDLATNIFINEQ
ncbi:glycosyltransferase family 2 protein [Polaribacter sp. NJDZ03]|uniref:glycosyltransferase family 2 protein n=1 Tax=Polaribacter sp. NJDZ03 TaxID=2855841 RepID=UPI001C49E482|nr:glycosyltransferase [Polaribacter sp. NJDZ03]